MATEQLPKNHRALVQHVYAKPLQVETIPTPQPTPGSAILKVLAASIISYMGNIYNGSRKYSYPTPLVTGTSAVGRVAAVGPDAASLKPGQLVFFDCTIRGRDDPSAIFLSGIVDGSNEGSKKLMAGEWRDSSYAEYVKVPLENCFSLNESLLCGKPNGFGYEFERLAHIGALLVPFGGLRDIRLEAGETVIIAPATGQFGGAAVHVALAMGARVIAMGRNTEVLAKFKTLYNGKRVYTVQITGNQAEEMEALKKFGPADAYFDISPQEAIKSSHFMSAILSLRHGGRISYMGGFLEAVPIPLRLFMRLDLKLHGKWMYSRDDIRLLVKMIEIGVLSMDENEISIVETFPLEEWEKAFETAAKHSAMGQVVLFKP